MAEGHSEHAQINRENWGRWAADFVEAGEESWAGEPSWGIWGIPETEIGVFPEDVAGKDVLELGCGTGYVSAWLARRGANVTGIDITPEQLDTARRLQREHGLEFPLIEGSGEDLPFPDESFDIAISEYGVCLWCDPDLWIPEASRVLRPGGELIFLTNGFLTMLTMPPDGSASEERLHRGHWESPRFEFNDKDGHSIEFHLNHGDWIRLLRANGFEIEDLLELQAPENATTRHPDIAPPEWARRWPSEEVWKARKR